MLPSVARKSALNIRLLIWKQTINDCVIMGKIMILEAHTGCRHEIFYMSLFSKLRQCFPILRVNGLPILITVSWDA